MNGNAPETMKPTVMNPQLTPSSRRGSHSGARLILLLCAWLGTGSAHAASAESVVAWGYNADGETTVPVAAQSGVIAIAAGGYQTVALRIDGSVVAWGENGYGQTTVPAAAQSGVVAVAAGGHHTLALKNDGSVLAWGYNAVGQTTVPAAAQSGVAAIAAGDYHSVALVIPSAPTVITQPVSQTVHEWQSASFTVAATGYPLSYQWRKDGENIAGATNATYRQTDTPIHQTGAAYTVVVSNFVGTVTSLPPAVLTVNARVFGTVVAWGFNQSGQTTVPVSAQSGVTAVVAGRSHTLALKNGSVLAWGAGTHFTGYYGEDYAQTTVPISAQSGVTAIAAGVYHSLALKNNGSVVAWGWNIYGQTTGTPTLVDPLSATADPVTLDGDSLSGVTAITAGYVHSVALINGRAIAWGDTGPHTDGVTTNVPVAARSGVWAIAAGPLHTLALKNDGSVVAWGYAFDQTTVPAGLNQVTAIAAGSRHNLALRRDGSVVAWGDNSAGQTTVPAAAQSGVVAIAAGDNHSVALKSDGSVVAWGWNIYGQTTVPTGLSAVTAIAAGANHTVAILGFTAPPAITSAPQGGNAVVGDDLLFNVVVTGTGPLRYQWFFDGRMVSGATNSTLPLINPQPAQAGDYSVEVNSPFGSVTSAVAHLTMVPRGPLDLWLKRESGIMLDLYGIAYGQGLFVAAGDSGAILTSMDGVTWTDRSVGGARIHAVAFLNGLFVAVGKSGAILTSPDAAVWTRRDTGIANHLEEVAYGNGVYAAVGTSGGAIVTSADAVTWTSQGLVATQSLNGITFGNGLFVAVGDGKSSESIILTSTNGVAWNRASSGTSKNLRGVAYGNGMFVVVGNDGTILHSLDGKDWVADVFPCLRSPENLRGVTYANGNFVAVGNLGTLLTSADGAIWTCRKSGTTNNLHSVAYGHGTLVAVGNSATIVQSQSFSPGSLTVRGRPNKDGFELAVTGEIGRTYKVQANHKVAATGWVDLFTFENLQEGATLFLDSRAGDFPQRFYRLISP